MDSERIIVRKAMAYDLKVMLKEESGLNADVVKVVVKMIDDYIANEEREEIG